MIPEKIEIVRRGLPQSQITSLHKAEHIYFAFPSINMDKIFVAYF